MGTNVQWQVLAPAADEQYQLYKAEVSLTEEVVPMVDSTPDTQNGSSLNGINRTV